MGACKAMRVHANACMPMLINIDYMSNFMVGEVFSINRPETRGRISRSQASEVFIFRYLI